MVAYAINLLLWDIIRAIYISEPKGKTCYTDEQVIRMLEFLIDNIFVNFGSSLFQQIVRIPMGTDCAPLLADSLNIFI